MYSETACYLVSSKIRQNLMLLSADAAAVPVVCVVLEGGPNTLKTVLSAIEKGTPTVIVKVNSSSVLCNVHLYNRCLCGMITMWH